jgi:hypothetical protein
MLYATPNDTRTGLWGRIVEWHASRKASRHLARVMGQLPTLAERNLTWSTKDVR